MRVWDAHRGACGEALEAGGRSPAILPERGPEAGPPCADRSASLLGGVRVVLDPGPAGGRSEGALWLLAVARSAAGRLRDLGATVSLTQEGDGSVPHAVRRLRARRADADLVLGLDVADPREGGDLGAEGRGVRLRYAPWRPWRTGPCRRAAEELMRELAAAGAVDAGVAPGLEGEGCRGVAGSPRSVSLLAVFGERWPAAADGGTVAWAIARGVGATFGGAGDWQPARAGIRAPVAEARTEPVEAVPAVAEPPGSAAEGVPGDPRPSPPRGAESDPPGPLPARPADARTDPPADPRTDPSAVQSARLPSAAAHPERSATRVEDKPLLPSWPEGADAGDAAWPPAALGEGPSRAAVPPPEAGGGSADPPETDPSASRPPGDTPPVGGRQAPADRQTAHDPAPVPPEPAARDLTSAQWQAPFVPASEGDESKAEEGFRVRGPGGPGRLAEMAPTSYMYDGRRDLAGPLRRRLAAAGFVRVDRRQTLDEWYRPFISPTALHVHFPSASSQSRVSADPVTVRRLAPAPPPAARGSARPVRVIKSR